MKQTKESLERVQLTDIKPKLVISQKVLNQIQHLCKEIAKDEWSGILFYSIDGTIKDPANLTFTVEEILPMHKGTAAYTEYTLDERVIDFMMEHEEAGSENWKMGHIHSHNTMAVYFSATDWSELEDNAPNHNFYLSLIVNNFMDFCAKVCFITESKEKKSFEFMSKDEEGKAYVYESKEFQVNKQKLVIFDCEIESPSSEIVVDKAFSEKVEGIIEAAKKRYTPIRNINYGGRTTPTNGTRIYAGAESKTIEPRSYGKSWQARQEEEKKKQEGKMSAWDKEDPFSSIKEKVSKKIEKEAGEAQKSLGDKFSEIENVDPFNEFPNLCREDAVEEFAMYVVNAGNQLDPVYADIEDVVMYYKSYHLGGKSLAKKIVDDYDQYYNAYFPEYPILEFPETFVDITKEVIEEIELTAGHSLDDYVSRTLKTVVEALTAMNNAFETSIVKI